MNQIDILLLAKRDHANAGYLYAEALRSVGINAEAWAVKPSPRGYSHHASLFTHLKDEIFPIAEKAKAILFMHTWKFKGIPLRDKFVTVFHGGSRYRFAAERMNEEFNPIVDKSIIQTGDLLGLGAKNEVWVLPPIDTKLIKPVNRPSFTPKLRIAHFPHKGYVKGTELIYNTLWKLKSAINEDHWSFVINDSKVSWEDNIARMARCDIYIEAVNPMLRGRDYGEWGMTALEAAALGKIVVTHFRSHERYREEYGSCPLIVANNKEQLYAELKRLIMMDKDQLIQLQRKTREWVEQKHSFEAVGTRLKEKVYGSVFSLSEDK